MLFFAIVVFVNVAAAARCCFLAVADSFLMRIFLHLVIYFYPLTLVDEVEASSAAQLSDTLTSNKTSSPSTRPAPKIMTYNHLTDWLVLACTGENRRIYIYTITYISILHKL